VLNWRPRVVWIALIALLSLTLGSHFFRQRIPADATKHAEIPSQISNDGAETHPETGAVEPADPSFSTTRSRESPEEAAETEAGHIAHENFPTDTTFGEYRSALWNEIRETPPRLANREEPEIDADTAYKIYVFLRWCGVTPRTDRQAEVRFQRIEDEIETAHNEEHLSGLKWSSNHDFMLYELCREVPPEVDCRLEAVKWLTKAVRLGHQVAQIEYYDSAIRMLTTYRPAYISSSLVLLHPELVLEFKDTSQFALSKAMERGHPEAYVVMSQAVMDGVVYPRNPILAYAYAHLAELEAMGSRTVLWRATNQKSLVSEFLELDEIAEGEQLGLEMQTTGNN